MLFTHRDHRTYLKQVLSERIRKNASYSLRAFASHLGISAGMLSDVLKGQKNLSAEKALEISERLDHSADEELYFLSLAQLANAKDPQRREKILERIQKLTPRSKIHDLSVDHFHSVANWLCASGMALLENRPRGLSAPEIASRFGVSAVEIEDAMDRWVRLDLVGKENGRYRKLAPAHVMMSSPAPDGALRKYHATMLEMASAALATQSNLEKFVGTETLAFDPRDLPLIETIIEEAVARILAAAKRGKKKTEVYHLGFQFFRTTKKEK